MGTKISQLPAAATPTGAEEIPLVQSSTTKKSTLASFATWIATLFPTLASLAASSGSSLVGFLQAGTGAVATTVQTKERQIVSVFDFMTAAQIADVIAGTQGQDVTTPINTAITAVNTYGSGTVYFPDGIYKTAGAVQLLPLVSLAGINKLSASTATLQGAHLVATGAYNLINCAATSGETDFGLYDLTLDCNSVGLRGVYSANFIGFRIQRVNVVRPVDEGIYLNATTPGSTTAYTADLEDVYVNAPGTICFRFNGPFIKMNRCVSDLGTYSLQFDGAGGRSMVTNCHFEGGSVGAILLNDGVGMHKIIGNNLIGYHAGQAKLVGIEIGNNIGCTKNIITGNTIYSAISSGSQIATSYGILTDGAFASNNIIGDNDILGFYYGMLIQSTNNSITGGWIDGAVNGISINGNTNYMANLQINASTKAIQITGGSGNTAVNVHDIAGTGYTGITPSNSTFGLFTGTLTGGTTTPTYDVAYSYENGVVTLTFPAMTVTSNATTKTVTGMPTTSPDLKPLETTYFNIFSSDSGGSYIAATGVIQTTGVVTLNKGPNDDAWTNSGTMATRSFTVTYPVATPF